MDDSDEGPPKCSFCLEEPDRGLHEINTKVFGLLGKKFVVLQEVASKIFNFQFQADDVMVCDTCHKQMIDSYKFVMMSMKNLRVEKLSRLSEISKKVGDFLAKCDDIEDMTVMEFNSSLAIVASEEMVYMKVCGFEEKADEVPKIVNAQSGTGSAAVRVQTHPQNGASSSNSASGSAAPTNSKTSKDENSRTRDPTPKTNQKSAFVQIQKLKDQKSIETPAPEPNSDESQKSKVAPIPQTSRATRSKSKTPQTSPSKNFPTKESSSIDKFNLPESYVQLERIDDLLAKNSEMLGSSHVVVKTEPQPNQKIPPTTRTGRLNFQCDEVIEISDDESDFHDSQMESEIDSVVQNHNGAVKVKIEVEEESSVFENFTSPMESVTASYENDDDETVEYHSGLENGFDADDNSQGEHSHLENHSVFGAFPEKSIEKPKISKKSEKSETSKKINWRKEIQKCRSTMKTKAGSMPILKCYLCKRFVMSCKGMKAHLENTHFGTGDVKPKDEEKVKDEGKFERDYDWVDVKVKESKTGKSDWTCSICNNVKSNCEIGIRRHILFSHCKKATKEQMLERSRIKHKRRMSINGFETFKYDPEIIEELAEKSQLPGEVESWTCCVCQKFSTGSGTGVRMHISKMHCEKLTKKEKEMRERSRRRREEDVGDRHERDTEWIKEQVEKSKVEDPSGAEIYTCCICNAVSSETANGIRTHITFIHTYGSTQKSERVVDPNKRPFDLEAIKEVIEKSKTDDGAYTCCLCYSLTTKKLSGIRNHVAAIHFERRAELEDEEDDSSDDDDEVRYDRDPQWVEEMIEKSKKTTDSEFTCCLCEKSIPSEKGLRFHIYHQHCKKEKLKQPKPDEDEGERHERDPVWVDEIMENSKNSGDPPSWTCCLCKIYEGDNVAGIRFHIFNKHCVKGPLMARPIKKEPGIEEEKHERDMGWVNEMIDKSKLDGLKTWECCICQKFDSKNYNGIRSHILHMHCVRKKEIDEEMELEDEEERHERDPVWIEQMIEDSNTYDGDFMYECCICKKFRSDANRGIYNHIVKNHCVKKPEPERTLPQEQDTDNDDDDKFRKDSDSLQSQLRKDWLRQKVLESSAHEDGLIQYSCVICRDAFKDKKSMKTHFTRTHRWVMEKEIQEAANRACDEDENDIEDMIEKCYKPLMASDNNSDVWVCDDCDGKKFFSSSEIRSHVINVHFSDRKLPKSFRKTRFDGEGSEDSADYRPRKRKRGRPVSNSDDDDECPAKIHKSSKSSAREDPGSQLEPYTEEHEFNDLTLDENDITVGAILTSIDNVKTEAPDDDEPQELSDLPGKFIKASDMTAKETNWVRIQMKKSKLGPKSFRCWMCPKTDVGFSNNQNMNYHLVRYHLYYYQQGIEKFKEHIEDCKKLTSRLSVKKLRPAVTKKLKLKEDSMTKKITTTHCTSCSMKYGNKRSYLFHMKMHLLTDIVVEKIRLLPCETCLMLFRNQRDLEMHLEAHKTKGYSEVVPARGYKVRNVGKWEEHHEELESYGFHCGHCGKKFGTELDMKRHVMFSHLNPLVCPMDNSVHYHINEFISHISEVHSGDIDNLDGSAVSNDCGNPSNASNQSDEDEEEE